MYRQTKTLLTPTELSEACQVAYTSPLGVVKTPLICAKEDGSNGQQIRSQNA